MGLRVEAVVVAAFFLWVFPRKYSPFWANINPTGWYESTGLIFVRVWGLGSNSQDFSCKGFKSSLISQSLRCKVESKWLGFRVSCLTACIQDVVSSP